jgi:hypothetical protein
MNEMNPMDSYDRPPNAAGAPDESVRYQGWVSVFECGTDFEADLVRDRLDEQQIPAVVLTQRDHVFNVNVGDLSTVHVMVQPEHEEAARRVVGEAPASDAELEAAAMSADPSAPEAHDPSSEASLDSGMESIDLSIPAQSEENERVEDERRGGVEG